MHSFKRSSLTLLAAAALTTACGDDKGDADVSTSDPTAPAATGDTTTGPPPTTSATSADTTTDTPADPFVFDETPPDAMVQLDRMGMPAVATAVISADTKDAYNAASPADDAASVFVPDIIKNVTALHSALDDDIMALKLVPCAADTCVAQGAPLVVPDTLQVDVSLPPAFPNGRTLTDPCIDITLAVVLLDLGVPGQTASTLANVPVNPPRNDKDFEPDFPYLASPH